MGFFSFMKKSPNIVESPPPPSIGQGAGMRVPEYKSKPYFIVASVEMGNTTTKCILTGTSLETGRTYVINKTVSMSRCCLLATPTSSSRTISVTRAAAPRHR